MATPMTETTATRVQMNGVSDSAPINGICRIASLVRALMNLKTLASELKHLGHEGHATELCIAIESF